MLMLMYLFTDFAVISLTLISVINYLFIPIGDILLTCAWKIKYKKKRPVLEMHSIETTVKPPYATTSHSL